jgi:hypothetical protein
MALYHLDQRQHNAAWSNNEALRTDMACLCLTRLDHALTLRSHNGIAELTTDRGETKNIGQGRSIGSHVANNAGLLHPQEATSIHVQSKSKAYTVSRPKHH